MAKKISKLTWIITVTFIVAVIISTFKYNRICIFGYGFGTVMSESMLPKYKVGSTVIIDYNSRPEVGEVGLYERDNMIIVHRLVSIENDGYHFKGDNNKVEDKLSVKEENVIGKVIYQTNITATIIEKIGLGVDKFRTIVGGICLLGIVVCIIGSIMDTRNKAS